MINTTFDFFSDTPKGKDPDSHSPTLRRYHQALWSKKLPNGKELNLAMAKDKYLYWRDFIFGSDAITNSYRSSRRLAAIIGEVKSDADAMFKAGSTIGAYIIFPSYRVERKSTINGARGMNARIADRFDLTLECIRRHYSREESPLTDVLARYADFFELFLDFKGYVDFFLLQDLATADYEIKFFLPFNDFERKGIPANADEYRVLKSASIAFIQSRGQRMLASSSAN